MIGELNRDGDIECLLGAEWIYHLDKFLIEKVSRATRRWVRHPGPCCTAATPKGSYGNLLLRLVEAGQRPERRRPSWTGAGPAGASHMWPARKKAYLDDAGEHTDFD